MSRYRDDDDDYRRGADRRAGEREHYDDYYRREREEPRRGDYGRDYGRDFGRDRYGEPIDYRADYLNRRGSYDARDERGYFERSGRERPPAARHPDEREYYAHRENARGAGGRGGGMERGRGGASRSHLRCRDIMTRDVTVATRETTLQEVAAMMRDEDTGIIPVVEQTGATFDNAESQNVNAAAAGSSSTTQTTNSNAQAGELRSERAGGGQQQPRANGKLVGLITDRDVVIRAIAAGKDPRTTRAEEIMTDDVYTAQPNHRVIDVIRTMGDKQVRRIPVVDDEGGLRGIISMADVALETEEDRELGNALEEISSGSSFWSKIFG